MIGRPLLVLGALAACGACANRAPRPAPALDAGLELPAGSGRDILVSACLNCHELGALELFKGHYGREDWRSLVVTMIGNGAEIEGAEIEVLADYLAEHFGLETP